MGEPSAYMSRSPLSSMVMRVKPWLQASRMRRKAIEFAATTTAPHTPLLRRTCSLADDEDVSSRKNSCAIR